MKERKMVLAICESLFVCQCCLGLHAAYHQLAAISISPYFKV